MQYKELYRHILGLESPWLVAEVKLDVENQQIDVHVEHPRETRFACPECGQSLACFDHVPDRQWRHLDSCQFKTILHANVPRVKCPEHGVKQVNVPWAAKGSRYTILFERLAIDILLATQTVTGAMSIPRTKWEQTWNILEHPAACGVAWPRPQGGAGPAANRHRREGLLQGAQLHHAALRFGSEHGRGDP